MYVLGRHRKLKMLYGCMMIFYNAIHIATYIEILIKSSHLAMYVVCQPFENHTYLSWLAEIYTKYGILVAYHPY